MKYGSLKAMGLGGLLAGVLTIYVVNRLVMFPLTTDMASWTAGPTLWLGAMVLALISMGVTATLSGLLLLGGGGGTKAAAAPLGASIAANGGPSSIPMVDPLGVIGVLAMALPVARRMPSVKG